MVPPLRKTRAILTQVETWLAAGSLLLLLLLALLQILARNLFDAGFADRRHLEPLPGPVCHVFRCGAGR